MKSFLGRYVVILCLPLFGATQFRSDYTYYQNVDGWLKLHRIPTTWQNAQVLCELEGAVLASPTTVQLLEAMDDLAKSKHTSRALFTGIHDTFSKGLYYSIEGVSLEDIPASWAPNEPNNLDGNEDCLILNPDQTMADVKCNDVYPYMCFRKRTDDMPPINVCGTIDNEYELDSETGNCYKYHSVIRPWDRAFMTCAAEGGHLAIANSHYEARLFERLFQRKRVTSGLNSGKKIVFLGFHYSKDQGWRTIHGQTLKHAGYIFWARGEPNHVPTLATKWKGEYCGSIDMGPSTPGLNDAWCEESQPFICEKSPKTLVPVTPKSIEESTTTEQERSNEIETSTDEYGYEIYKIIRNGVGFETSTPSILETSETITSTDGYEQDIDIAETEKTKSHNIDLPNTTHRPIQSS